MGAFCVFGVSRQVCRAKAERTVLPYYMDGEKKRYLTAPEWGGE
jgi:hypothetical protein